MRRPAVRAVEIFYPLRPDLLLAGESAQVCAKLLCVCVYTYISAEMCLSILICMSAYGMSHLTVVLQVPEPAFPILLLLKPEKSERKPQLSDGRGVLVEC